MKYSCFVCNKPIIKERAQILIADGVHIQNLTCTAHSQTKKIKAIYFGEHGTSDLVLCDEVYEDNVRSKFIDPQGDDEEESDS